MLRRETIIALRARHTAWRIATAIMHPPQPPPESPPSLPLRAGEALGPVVVDQDWLEQELRRGRRRHWRALVAILLMWVLALVLLGVLYEDPPPAPPPVPQGRPILPAQ